MKTTISAEDSLETVKKKWVSIQKDYKINSKNLELSIQKWKDHEWENLQLPYKEEERKKYKNKKDYYDYLSTQIPNPTFYNTESEYLKDISDVLRIPKWYFINNKPLDYNNMLWIDLKKLLFYRNKWVNDQWMSLSVNEQKKYKNEKTYYEKVLLKQLPKKYEQWESEDGIKPTWKELENIYVPIFCWNTVLNYGCEFNEIPDYSIKNSNFTDKRKNKVKQLSNSLKWLLKNLDSTRRWVHGYLYQYSSRKFDYKKLNNDFIKKNSSKNIETYIRNLRLLGVRVVRRHYDYPTLYDIRDEELIKNKYHNNLVPLYNVYEFSGLTLHDDFMPTIFINGMLTNNQQKEVLTKGIYYLKQKKYIIFDLEKPIKRKLKIQKLSEQKIFDNLIDYVGHLQILYELDEAFESETLWHRRWNEKTDLTYQECYFLKDNMYNESYIKTHK